MLSERIFNVCIHIKLNAMTPIDKNVLSPMSSWMIGKYVGDFQHLNCSKKQTQCLETGMKLQSASGIYYISVHLKLFFFSINS